MPFGTVITRFRLTPGVVSTTYAVITFVIEPIGRSSVDDLDQRFAPVAAFASSAHRDWTPAGAAAFCGARAAAPAASAARAAGAAVAPPATTNPATTAPAASPPAIRIGPPSAHPDG